MKKTETLSTKKTLHHILKYIILFSYMILKYHYV